MMMDADGMPGDIWTTGAFSFESPLKDLLDSGSYTVEQLLGEDELLQELRGMHPQLVEFFSREESVVKLVQHCIHPTTTTTTTTIIEEEEETTKTGTEEENKDTILVNDENNNNEEEEKKKGEWLFGDEFEKQQQQEVIFSPVTEEHQLQNIRYPYVACEVICCEISAIIDTFVDGHVSTPSSGVKRDLEVATDQGEAVEVIVTEEQDEQKKDPRPQLILDLFFSLLHDTKPGELDDYRAGYFDKVLAVLCKKRPQAMKTYINEGAGRGSPNYLIKAMLTHLYSHSILQVVQRFLLPQEEPQPDEQEEEEREKTNELWGVVDDDPVFNPSLQFRCTWSETNDALEMLVHILLTASSLDDPELCLYEAQNASEVLITVIQNSPLTSPAMLYLTKEPSTKIMQHVSQLLSSSQDANGENHPFGPHDSAFTCCMNVLESLILQLGGFGSVNGEPVTEDNNNKAADDSSDVVAATPEALVSSLAEFLNSLATLLKHPLATSWVSPMQFCPTEPRAILGTSRLRIVRLVEALVLLGHPDVDKALCDSGCLEMCLDLFWEFEWNSMLHQSVANLLVHVFEGANSRAMLQEYLINHCNLLKRLIGSFEDDKSNQEEVLPVSDDSADDMEKQTDDTNNIDSTKAEESGVEDLEGKSQEDLIRHLRKGFMGHVIIICQALVHACTQADGSKEDDQEANNDDSIKANDEEEDEDEYASNLVIAKLVQQHPLEERWQEFVTTLLASETAIQSTPLGGFNASTATMDPLQAHRPLFNNLTQYNSARYGEDDDDVEKGSNNRGLSVGGEPIDMDDNDIEIAASMMDALSLPPQVTINNSSNRNSAFHHDDDDDKFDSIGDSPFEVPAANITPGGDYLFDDPLGSTKDQFGNFQVTEKHHVDDDDDDEKEEEENDDDSDDEDEQPRQTPPVMDLFAGNFSFGEQDNGSGEWSNFANFDDAFAGFSASPPSEGKEETTSTTEDNDDDDDKEVEKEGENNDVQAPTNNNDDIFGATPTHALLLDDPVATNEDGNDETDDEEKEEMCVDEK